MRIHHWNLCTMCPYGGRLVSGGSAPILSQAEMLIHAMLVETAAGLVLIETGIGLDDMRNPGKRLGHMFTALGRPRLREEETAIRQVERLGHSARDVRDIVVTHLDLDHAGGLADFPDARVHVMRAERDAALQRPTMLERERYKEAQLAHGPRWEVHDAAGEKWFGFESVRAIADDILLVPLPGHTRGHACIAVRAPKDYDPSGRVEWLLHCGDAYFFHGEREDEGSCPPALRFFQQTIAFDDRARRANAARLRALHAEHKDKVRIFSAHSPVEYRELATGSRT